MPENPYAIPNDSVSALTESLAAKEPSTGSRQFSVHLVESAAPERFLALKLTGDVFHERFGDTPEALVQGYSKYFSSMLHLVVIDRENLEPVGALSFIRKPTAELMTVVDIRDQAWNQPVERTIEEIGLGADDVCWDIATIAVPRKHRRTPAMASLFHAMYVVSRDNGVTHWTTVLDDPLRRGLRAMIGDVFRPIGGRESVSYFGSDASTALAGHVPTPDDIASGRIRPRQLVADGVLLERNVAFCGALQAIRDRHAIAPMSLQTSLSPLSLQPQR